MSHLRNVDWYFDFISPFAYLQFKHLHRLPKSVAVNFKPVLFAGLLGHWEHKGPAEIPAKRRQTYQFCHWHAAQLGVPFKTPPAHPFNPLGVLRLAIALNTDRRVVETIFDHVWGAGLDVHSADGLESLCAKLSVTDPDALIGASNAKDTLRHNTEQAIEAGVYGVPTLAVDDELFWGFDLTDMFLAYIQDPQLLKTDEMLRLANLPQAAKREQSRA